MILVLVRVVAVSVALSAFSGAVATAAQAEESPPPIDDGRAGASDVPDANPDNTAAGAPAPTAAPRQRLPPPPSRQQRDSASAEESSRASAETGHKAGFAIEFATGGFASGALQGGIFIGGRTAGGFIIGGIVDYASSSETQTLGTLSNTTSTSAVRLGLGMRFLLARTADRRVDLYGAGEMGVAVFTTSVGNQAQDQSAFGLTLGLGPGVRLWVHEHVAVGYTAIMRLTYRVARDEAFSGATDTIETTRRDMSFAGTFQVLAVF